MTIDEAKKELEKFVKLKTTMRPAFLDVILKAEPVVHCKDCKHWEKTYGWNCVEYTSCSLLDRDTNENFYCAYGATMDEVNDDTK